MTRRTVVLLLCTVVLAGAGIAWAMPSASPLCCGGASQMGRFGKLLALRSSSGVVVWDAWKQRTWVLPGAGTGAAAATAQGNAVVFAEGGQVFIGDMHTGAIAVVPALHFLRPEHVMISGDSRFVAVQGSDAQGEGIWRLDRDHAAVVLVSTLDDGGRLPNPELLELSADGRYIGFRTGNTVRVFDGFRGMSWVIWPKS